MATAANKGVGLRDASIGYGAGVRPYKMDIVYASTTAYLAAKAATNVLSGSAEEGDWFYDSTDNTFKVYTGSAWQSYSPFVGSDAAGDILYKSSATATSRLAIGSAGAVLRVNGGGTAPTWSNDCTNIDFTTEPEVAIFAKTTGAIKTAANAQQDFFRIGNVQQHYFELTQGVGATGANTLLAANGLTPAANGWLLTLDDTATDSLEITQGITLGSAKSFTTGTSAAFRMRCAFLVGTRANITHLGIGFRKLGAYVTANTAAEWATAYDDKAMIGIVDNAGALGTKTSLATVDVETALAAAAIANGDVLALEVNVSAAGVVTYRIARATPAGSTAAQMQAAVTTAYAALAADASAVAYTFGAATVVIPSIIIGASGAGAPDIRIVNYFCGSQ